MTLVVCIFFEVAEGEEHLTELEILKLSDPGIIPWPWTGKSGAIKTCTTCPDMFLIGVIFFTVICCFASFQKQKLLRIKVRSSLKSVEIHPA